jgi:carbon starvation protein
VPGKLFPFCFITIACGAISGFHTLIASGTTPKLITRESYARPIGYGAMCLESLVAIMAIIAACTMDPGVYFGMNIKGEAAVTAANMTAANFPVTVEHMDALAKEVGEKTLFGRTGGAATLAVGMAQIFGKFTNGKWLDLWYHFAVMFEALFILTTIDAGTRVGRYIMQGLLGHIWKPLGDTHKLAPNLFASVMVVGAWGIFLIQGVHDPLGGINSLWPLFGIANQMLAAIALCLATTILLKMQLESKAQSPKPKVGRPALALITLIPLVWLLTVTFTAGVEKIFHSDTRIGFLAQAHALDIKINEAERLVLAPGVLEGRSADEATELRAKFEATKAELPKNRTLRFNNMLDATVAATFLILVSIIVLISIREWILLLSRRKSSQMQECEPVWLPDYAVAEGKPLRVAGAAALALTLAKELSGESHVERARQQATIACECNHQEHVAAKSDKQIYDEVTKERFTGVRRCC